MADNVNEIKIANPFEEAKFVIETGDDEENYAKVVCAPLAKGFGVTLGNAMRRVLLSSLPGCSVYSVEVEGAVHEFTALEGVEEDLTQIILNLKELVIKSDTIALERYEAKVSITGPKTFLASDIELPTGLSVVNANLEIAHVAEGGHLEMIIHFKNGRGFATSEENKVELVSRGKEISTDSNFSPVIRCNYKVENTRVGHDPRFDKLVLEVWTNGSISPKDAISLSAKILVSHFNNFSDLTASFANLDLIKDEVIVEEDQFENLTIEELDLTVRSYNCLKRAGIANVLELTQRSETEMMKVRNLGKKSLKEVKDKLTEKGLSFKDSKLD